MEAKYAGKIETRGQVEATINVHPELIFPIWNVTNPSVKYVTLFSPDPAVPLDGSGLLYYVFAARVNKPA